MQTKNTIPAFFFVALAVVLFATPILNVHAQGDGGTSSSAQGITNPLQGSETITDVLAGIIKWMLGLVGFLALIALIIGGGRMVIDFGNEEQVKKGKATVLWAVIGLAVVILSYAILNIVTSEILGGGGVPPSGT